MRSRLKFWNEKTGRLGRALGVAVLALGLPACQILAGAEKIAEGDGGADGAVSEGSKGFSFDKLRAQDPQSAIGAKEHPRILKAYGGAYEDENLEALLAVVAADLVSQGDNTERIFDITILNSPTVNAFALPGGYLYVTRGLLALANDRSELAAVLAHEMAHVSSNHGIARSEQIKAGDLADAVASEIVSNPLVSSVAKAAAKQKLSSFSQKQELQADAISIRMIGKTGYDPFAAARFLKSMDRYTNWRDADEGDSADMSQSHPSTPQRIEVAGRHARLVGPPGAGERGRERFLQGIDGMVFGDVDSEGYIRANRFLHQKLGITFSVPSDFNLKNRVDAVLAAGPQQLALRFDAVLKNSTSAQSAVSYLTSGWVNGLDENSVEGRTIGKNIGASGRAEAGDWQFSINVLDYNDRYFRFILAAPRNAVGLAATGRKIAETFRPLTKKELADLKPLKVKIVSVGRRDTVASMSKKMRGVSRPEELFRALNGLDAGEKLTAGTKVKLIQD